MTVTYLLGAAILLPVLSGLFLLFFQDRWANRTVKCTFIFLVLAVTSALVVRLMFMEDYELVLWSLTDTLDIRVRMDDLTRLFAGMTAAAWTLGGVFSFEYMKHEEHEDRYFGFYLIVMGVLISLDHAGNLVTLYLFFEMMTLTSLPLVLHNLSHEAVMAGLKYLFYSIAGAFAALFGIFYLYAHGIGGSFAEGGFLMKMDSYTGSYGMTLFVLMLVIVGFGTKAGMFPMHGWLPTAHPVAPAPASAVLSGIITKSGVLAIIRVIFYTAGADVIRGTWVQYTWMTLALITVFMGSMMAYKEPLLKKRLAYSTVSQVSYILFGLSVLNADGMTGALSHFVFHSVVKNCLFLAAGAIIYRTGKTMVSELKGIGKEMPVTMWCFTLVSVTLVGIPPTSGFVSKWYLAVGSLEAGMGAYAWIGPVVLLLSAMLTAGYLLPISIQAFFPGIGYEYDRLEKKEPNLLMTVPMVLFTAAAVLFGMFPAGFLGFLQNIAAGLL
ncbi:MAG: proton-conducting membrane transporter [Clostridiales bacterium]|nr:proton-conducting membrane transporter [Clostridiales bacterium]